MSTNLYDPDAELERLYAAITGRPAFSYDPASDPVYNSYAQSYQRRGRLAMRNTMGQAAALTGGYGSSYAQQNYTLRDTCTLGDRPAIELRAAAPWKQRMLTLTRDVANLMGSVSVRAWMDADGLHAVVENNTDVALCDAVLISSLGYASLGDLAAGTMVIRTPRTDQMHFTLSEFSYARSDYKPLYPEVQQLSLGQIDVVNHILDDQVVYSDEQVEQLATKIERMLDIKREPGMDATDLLRTVAHDYQHVALQVI